ncbi:hypothetical protein JY97_05045 [Alkalispirochaeta odontotermitis]|nr:hypothetical protein JY97_05045 [Alkalispirochaeta odontotermitis]
MVKLKNVSNISSKSDEELEKFWDKHEPEEFKGWEEGNFNFKRLPKKLIQLRLDPSDVRIIDRESKRTGIDRAQLVRSWVKEKIGNLDKEAHY